MDKMAQYILVVPRERLLGEEHFDGFVDHTQGEYYQRILDHYHYMKRGLAEEDPSHKQPIAYTVIVDAADKKILAYQRSADKKNYTEKKLFGKWSWGVGGHIDKIDASEADPVLSSMHRELAEEIGLQDQPDSELLGYINIEDGVGGVHFGVVHVIPLADSSQLDFSSPELAQAKFLDVDELKELLSSEDVEVETWSEVLIPALEEYFAHESSR